MGPMDQAGEAGAGAGSEAAGGVSVAGAACAAAAEEPPASSSWMRFSISSTRSSRIRWRMSSSVRATCCPVGAGVCAVAGGEEESLGEDVFWARAVMHDIAASKKTKHHFEGMRTFSPYALAWTFAQPLQPGHFRREQEQSLGRRLYA